MANPKKGALHQVFVVMVDATDFASVESAITASDFTSGVTAKFYGMNTGGSAATTSGAISKAASLVRSGVFRVTLKGSENNYDTMMARFNKTGCAEQILVWDNVDNDDSDIMSAITLIASMASDAHSAAILGASHASDALSAVGVANSRILLVQSRLSDLDSRLVSDLSDVRSAIALIPVAVSASDMSDIASRVWATTIGARVDSRVLVIQSMASDAHSAAILGASTASLAQVQATAGASRALLIQSRLSDLDSRLVLDVSDLASKIGNVSVALTASDISDIASAVAAAVTTVTASDISDIASAVWANTIGARVDSRLRLAQSMASDAASAAQQANSRVLVVQSLASDAHSAALLAASAASDAYSAVVVVQSRLSDLDSRLVSDVSDIRSQLTVIQSMASDAHSAAILGASHASDAHSAATVAASRALLNQSRISDVYSLLSDVSSDLGVLSGVLSDVQSAVAAGVELGASTLSDLRSAITANGVLRAGAEPTAVIGHTDTLAAKMDWLAALARNKVTQTATAQTLRNDADDSNIASAAVSDDGTTFTRGEFV